MSKNNQYEAGEQTAFFQWAAYKNELKWMHSSLNGAVLAGDKKQRAIQVNRLKAQGMKAGVLDILLLKARGAYHGMLIEMKFGKNKMTEEQKKFAIYHANEGYCVFTCYNSGEAIAATELYLKLKPEQVISSTCPFLSENYT